MSDTTTDVLRTDRQEGVNSLVHTLWVYADVTLGLTLNTYNHCTGRRRRKPTP